MDFKVDRLRMFTWNADICPEDQHDRLRLQNLKSHASAESSRFEPTLSIYGATCYRQNLLKFLKFHKMS